MTVNHSAVTLVFAVITALLASCANTNPITTLSMVDGEYEDSTRQYLCLCIETGEQVCSLQPTMPSCPSYYSCSPVEDCGGGGNPFPKLLSHAIVRKLDGDGCSGEQYDFTSRAFYSQPGKTMEDFQFGFSDASMTDGCSLSIALIQTYKPGWFNRDFWEVTMEWKPITADSESICTGPRAQRLPVNVVAPEDTVIDPSSLTFSDPITIRPGGVNSVCELQFHRPQPPDEPPCMPWPLCNVHGQYSNIGMDIMFQGMGEEHCDIEWIIDVDPTQRIYRAVETARDRLLYTFKQSSATSSCNLSLISGGFFRPGFGRTNLTSAPAGQNLIEVP